MGRLLATALVAWLCQGCFVLEELDKGQAIMDQHSGRKAREEKAAGNPGRLAARAAGEEDPNWIATWTEKAEGWWREARRKGPPEPDPDDIVVRCGLGERTWFTRKSDCLIRGGRIL